MPWHALPCLLAQLASFMFAVRSGRRYAEGSAEVASGGDVPAAVRSNVIRPKLVNAPSVPCIQFYIFRICVDPPAVVLHPMSPIPSSLAEPNGMACGESAIT